MKSLSYELCKLHKKLIVIIRQKVLNHFLKDSYFYIYIFHILKCLKIYQLNIIKKQRNISKKAHERYQDLFEAEKTKEQ